MKRVLFVCQANVGCSQAAAELYRRCGGVAGSAGTNVDQPGQTLIERPGAVMILSVMRDDYGIDMAANVRTQIMPGVAKDYDQLIVMAESETIPEWLQHDERTEFWAVDDPKGRDESTTHRIVGEIHEKIKALVS
jgi:protein-tyrosine-phosphatase